MVLQCVTLLTAPSLINPLPTRGRGLLLTGITVGPRVCALCCSVWWKSPPTPTFSGGWMGFHGNLDWDVCGRDYSSDSEARSCSFVFMAAANGASSRPIAKRLADGYNGLIKSRGKSSELLGPLLLMLPHGWILKEGTEKRKERGEDRRLLERLMIASRCIRDRKRNVVKGVDSIHSWLNEDFRCVIVSYTLWGQTQSVLILADITELLSSYWTLSSSVSVW